MARHHFVPQFLLRRWARNGQINSFSWSRGAQKVLETPVAVRKACQIEDLNSFYGVPRGQRDAPEKHFFTPVIDTPADDALTTILTRGVHNLLPEQRYAWARFIVSLGVRTPETLREMGPIETRKGIRDAQTRAAGPPDLEAVVTSIMESRTPEFERNFPLKIAMELASDPTKILSFSAMHWWTRRLDRTDILVGDRPLLAMPRMPYPCGIPLDRPDCLVILPIAPNTVFFASAGLATRAKTRNISYGKLTHVINEETIACAKEYVYSLDSSPAAFVKGKLTQKATDISQGIRHRQPEDFPE